MKRPLMLKAKGLKRAMTLVEMMVVVAVGFIIISLIAVTYTSASRQYVRQDNLIEQMQNLRVAMYTIARDVRMAGSGFQLLAGGGIAKIQIIDETGNWFTHPGDDKGPGVRPIYGQNGVGPGGSDTLTVCWLGAEFGTPIGYLEDDFPAGGSMNQIELATAVIDDDELLRGPINDSEGGTLRGGDYLILVNDTTDEAVAFRFNGFTDGRRKVMNIAGLTRSLPGGMVFPAGSAVFNVRDFRIVTYSLSDNNELVANLHGQDLGDGALVAEGGIDVGGVVVATNIEDFQVRYLPTGSPLDTDHTTNSDITRFSEKLEEGVRNWPIAGLHLGLVSISRAQDPAHHSYRPLALFDNRSAPGTEREADGFARRMLTEVVRLRNVQVGGGS